MSEAGFVCIGQVAECFSGYPFESKEFCPPGEGDARVFRGDNLKEGYSEWGAKEKRWKAISPGLEKYQLKQNDVLVGMDGSKVGKNWTRVDKGDLPALLGQRVCRIRAGEFADQDFIFHVFGSYDFKSYVECVKTGTSIPHISNTQIRDFGVFLPPLPEQKKIAEILSGIDNLAKAKEKSLFKYKNLLLANISREYSDASRSHRHRLSLAELAQEVKRGPSLATNSEKKGIRYITSGNIADGKICLERDNKFLDEFHGIDTCTIKANDLVLNCVNSSTKIGESAIFDRSEHCITGFNNFAITLFPHLCSPHYIYYWTTSANFKSQVRTIIKDAINQVSFSKKDLREFSIYLPDLAEQHLVATKLESIQKVCNKKNQELIALKNLKSGISSLLLSGRKRVSI